MSLSLSLFSNEIISNNLWERGQKTITTVQNCFEYTFIEHKRHLGRGRIRTTRGRIRTTRGRIRPPWENKDFLMWENKDWENRGIDLCTFVSHHVFLRIHRMYLRIHCMYLRIAPCVPSYPPYVPSYPPYVPSYDTHLRTRPCSWERDHVLIEHEHVLENTTLFW